MLWNGLYLTGSGMAIGSRVPVEPAVADGRYDAAEAANTEQLTVAIADPETGAPDLAVAGARQALQRSGHPPEEIDLILHGVVLHAGLDAWNPASYIQRELGVANPRCLVTELRSGCDGLVGVELAAAYLTALPHTRAALITGADVWGPPPAVDRWRVEPGIVYGDAGGAVVLSKRPGFARLLSTATITDPSLEALHRGNEPFGPFRTGADHPVDLGQRRRQFLTTMESKEVARRIDAALRLATDQATADAGVKLADIRHVALQFYGTRTLRLQHLKRLGLEPHQVATSEFGRGIGHTGPADVLAGINHLRESGRLAPGDLALVLGEGGGYLCTALIFEALAQP